MLKTLAAFVLLTLAGIAHAESLHPCTPTVHAMPTEITCVVGPRYYSITVDTLMSPNFPMCRGANHLEYKTAQISVSDQKGRPFGKLEILDGEFSYVTNPDGTIKFDSDTFFVHFNHCTSPLQGGISIGN